MAKVDTDKFIALLIETYCRRMGIDRTLVATIVKMLANSYCPDYFNRKRQKKTLEQWLDEMNIPRSNIEEFDKLHHS